MENSPADTDDGPAPNLDAMIGASIGAAATGAATALDELAEDIADGAAGELPGGDELPAAPAAAVKPRRPHRRTGNRPGRPRNDGAPAGAAAAPGVVSDRTPKQQLADENEQLKLENARLRALADGATVAQLAQSIELLTVVCFGVIAEARGAHWAATTEEAHAVGESAAVAAAPYAEQLQRSLPWVAPLIALGSMIGKRVMIDARMARDARAQLEL